MAMTGITRTSSGVAAIDTTHLQNVITNLKAKIAAGAVMNAQDVTDLAWCYNYWIQHTHSYYDHAYEKYGNVNGGAYQTYSEVRYNDSNYVGYGGGVSHWIWDGSWVVAPDGSVYQGGLTPPDASWWVGAYMGTIYGSEGDYTERYQIGHSWTQFNEYTGGSIGGWETSTAINGLDWFDYGYHLEIGDTVTAWVINDLMTLVNSIRTHTHTWYEDYLDYAAP